MLGPHSLRYKLGSTGVMSVSDEVQCTERICSGAYSEWMNKATNEWVNECVMTKLTMRVILPLSSESVVYVLLSFWPRNDLCFHCRVPFCYLFIMISFSANNRSTLSLPFTLIFCCVVLNQIVSLNFENQNKTTKGIGSWYWCPRDWFWDHLEIDGARLWVESSSWSGWRTRTASTRSTSTTRCQTATMTQGEHHDHTTV